MHEVGDQPLEQHGITGHSPRPDSLLDRHVVLVGQADRADQHGLRDLVQPDGDAAAQAAVAAREHQQTLDQPFAALVRDEQVLAEFAQVRRGFRVRHGDFDECSLHGQRRAQFV
ncbi:hypothetical protein SAMN05661093_10444 [Kibdelosporangium aridum]|uniref:Uncharacterized protein n=1 Tax=Kibdelosporangium aridum TaxID=2030 RepID=A0A1Y5Y7V0_KIBAR|nr:hypothetical protein SAMN05661093_10444 [Kibdelosporangium aridum]